ncbi:hypothetical protein [Streptomyces prasinus]
MHRPGVTSSSCRLVVLAVSESAPGALQAVRALQGVRAVHMLMAS